MKRHIALQDYSREHHDELLLVWKIRQGLKNKIPPDRIFNYCNSHFNEVTSLHMKKEEEYILSKLPDDDSGKRKIIRIF